MQSKHYNKVPDDHRSLMAQDQYRIETAELPRVSDDEVLELVEMAREGSEEAAWMLVESCLSYVTAIAYNYHARNPKNDPMDLIGVGNEALVKSLSRAIWSPSPLGHLKVAARRAIICYCMEQGTSIRVPSSSYMRGRRAPAIASLDAPYGEDMDATLLDVLAAESYEDDVFDEDETAKMKRLRKIHKGSVGEMIKRVFGPPSPWSKYYQYRDELSRLLRVYPNLSYSRIAKHFGVANSTVGEWIARLRADESYQEPEITEDVLIDPIPQLAPQGKYYQYRDELSQLLRMYPHLSHGRIANHFGVAKSTVGEWIVRLWADESYQEPEVIEDVPVDPQFAPQGKYYQYRDELSRLLRMYPHLSHGRIANHFGVAKSTVREWVTRLRADESYQGREIIEDAPVDPQFAPRGKYYQYRDELSRLLRMYPDLSQRDIANRLGVSKSTANEWIIRLRADESQYAEML